MSEYIIVAKISKIILNTVSIKGVGKYCYEDSNKVIWNLLEENIESSNLILLDPEHDISIGINKGVCRVLFSLAMFNQKPLKMIIKKDELKNKKVKYTITAVEMP